MQGSYSKKEKKILLKNIQKRKKKILIHLYDFMDSLH